jgi:hypothetical protein
MADAQAWDQGWAMGAGRAQEGRAHKQALSDQELEGKIQELVDNRKAIQGKLPTLLDEQGNPTPQYNEAITALTQNARDLREVYHPQKQPGAIDRFGHILTDALHLTSTSDRQQKQGAKQDSLAAGDRKQAQMEAAAAPVSPTQAATQEGQSKAAGNLAFMQASLKNLHTLFPDATPEQMTAWHTEMAQSMTGGKPIAEKYFSQLSTTTDANGKQHVYRVPMDPTLQPEEVDFNGQKLDPKSQAHPSTSQFNESREAYAKSYGFQSFDGIPAQLQDAAVDYVIRKSALDRAYPTSTTSTRIIQDANGREIPVTETNYRTPGGNVKLVDPLQQAGYTRGAAGASGQPPTPESDTPPPVPTPKAGAGKGATSTTPKTSGGGTGNTHVGAPLFQGKTPTISKAQTDVMDATKLDSLAKQVASNPNDAINQKRLAVSLEKMSAGRFTTQALDYVIKSGWGNTLEQWANNPSTGALPTDVVRQLVDGAHQNLRAAQDALKEATNPDGGSSDAGDADIDSIVKALNQHKAK